MSYPFYKSEVLQSYKTHSHVHVTDSDLQIRLEPAASLESTVSFKAILSQYTGEIYSNPDSFMDPIHDSKELRFAMASAEDAYSSMMQIRKELEQAYREFLQFHSR